MSNIKVKAYGLVALKKKTYLAIQGIGAVLLVLGLAISLIYDFSQSSNSFLKYLFWICLVTIILEIFETFFMLRRYRQKERDG